MKKMKIASIMIVAIMIGVSSASIAGSINLAGDIDIKVDDYIGIVTPTISLVNQSIVLDADLEGTGDDAVYHVNETLLFINLDIEDNSGRENFFAPRTIAYCVVMTRNFADAKILPIKGIIGRLFPHVELFKTANVVDSTVGGEKQTSINVTLDYFLPSNESYDNGEELTMYIYMIGILPGDTNGVSDTIPIIAHKKITLDISYV